MQPSDHTSVSRETSAKFQHYKQLLEKWNPAINLVSKASLAHIDQRHIADSAQIWNLQPQETKKWLDIGSGAGFPGVVVAIIAQELAPEMEVICVESDSRKAAFLLTAARELGLSMRVANERIEAMEPQSADVISARALAPLDQLLEFADRHLKPTGTCLFLKGNSVETEIAQAKEKFSFRLVKHQSTTESGGVILEIGDLKRV